MLNNNLRKINKQAQANALLVEIIDVSQKIDDVALQQSVQHQNCQRRDYWSCDCSHYNQTDAIDVLVTKSKAKGPLNWKEQKEIQDKVQQTIQKYQGNHVLDNESKDSDDELVVV